ncbi:MAG: PEGA domain-containing protein [Patescibacteria group bacterium]
MRRLIFYFTLGTFLIAAPTIILYTAGFRYNFKQKRIVKTGAIILSSDPKNAEISLNGRPRQEHTPARILNLTPGDYTVRVASEGFQPWQKTLRVESEQVTLAENITLFRQGSPERIAEGNIPSLLPEPAGENILFVREEGSFYEIWRHTDGRNSLLWRSALQSQPQLIEWSSKRNEVLLFAGEYFLLDMDPPAPELKSLTQLTGKTWKSLAYGKNQTLLFGISGETLYSINPNTGAADVIEQASENFTIAPNEIYTSSADTEGTLLKLIRGATSSTLTRIESGAWTWAAASDPWLILADLKREKLAVVNAKTKEISEIDGTRALFLPGEEVTLLASTDFEIWRYRPSTKKTELLTRLSEPIQKILITELKNAFIAVTDHHVYALELDTRGKQNSSELATFDSIQSASLDRHGKILYLAAEKNNTPGLWRVEIR